MEHSNPIGDQDGATIRAIRKLREKSVREVCDLLAARERIEIHPNSLRNVETNARGASEKLIGALARILEVEKTDIIRDPNQLRVGESLKVGASF